MALEGNLVKLEGLGMNPSRAEHNFYFFFFLILKYANEIGHPQRPFVLNILALITVCDVSSEAQSFITHNHS